MRRALTRALRGAGVRFVRVVTCSTANVIRSKAANVDGLEDVFQHGVGVTAALPALPVMYDAVVQDSGLGPVGEIRLMPDWETLQLVPYAPGHAQVIGDVMLDGEPWTLDPRYFLRRMVAEAGAAGLEVCAGYELEFYLLDPNRRPADDTVFAATLGMDIAHPVIGELVAALGAQDIPVQQFYPEAGPGQFELPLGPADPLTTADRMLYARQALHAVARRAGMRATVLPKVFDDEPGNGAHCHFSLWREGRNVTGEPGAAHGLSSESLSFIAGILDHLPALAALTVASRNSYRRLRPRTWSGAFRAWGTDNREVAVRVPSGANRTAPSHIELKTSDASSNPYLALGGIDPLPESLEAAVGALERDAVLMEALGPDLARAYAAVKRFEWQALKDVPLDEEVSLLMERY